MSVTDWFAGNVWPARQGWYEVRSPNRDDVTRCWYGDGGWSLMSPIPGMDIDSRLVWGPRFQWRGLAAQQ